MKKMVGFIIILTSLLIYAFFSQSTDKETLTKGDGVPVIGILQLTSHPALDKIRKGIIDTLAEEGYVEGKSVKIVYENAQGDQSNLNAMSEHLVNQQASVIAAITTPSAQALANATTSIPIVLAGVTNPEGANLVNTNEKPGGNITGVADQTPIKKQISLIKKLLPQAKKIGILYSSSEDNSILNAKEAEKRAKEKGFETVTMTVSSTNDVAQVGTSLARKVDAIWVPSDNTIASSLNTLIDAADNKGIPVFPPVDTMVEQGGLATVGIDQYEMGKQAGEMTVSVLEGTIDTADKPIQLPKKTALYINQQQARKLNIAIPKSLLNDAVLFDKSKGGKQ